MEKRDEAGPVARLRETDASWRLVRWCGAVFAFVLILLYEPPAGVEVPFPALPVAVGFSAAVVAVNAFSLVDRRRAGVRALARRGLYQLAADTALVLGLIWLYSFDTLSSQWAILIIPVIEGAMRRQLVGALATWTVVAAGYTAQQFWAHAEFGYDFALSSLAYRMAIVLIVAAIAGIQARNLEGQITALQDARAQLQHAAFHDALTGLPNRALFADRMVQALGRARREEADLAVLFIDCDDFKAVNDRLGHDAGDQALVELGRRLRNCIRPGDTVARMGGDEFTVLLEPPTGNAEAAHVAERVLAVLREPFHIRSEEVTLSASVGVATGRSDPGDPDALLRLADDAMYAAKQGGKDQYRVVG